MKKEIENLCLLKADWYQNVIRTKVEALAVLS